MRSHLPFSGRRTPALLLALSFLHFAAPNADAADFIVLPDTKLQIGSFSDTDNILLPVARERSYCLKVQTLSPSGDLVTLAPFPTENEPGILPVSQPRGSAYPRVYAANAFAGSENARICFITIGTSTSEFAQLSFDVETSAGGATGPSIATVSETTLFGGFNTSVTDFNFLELTNTTSSNDADTGQVAVTVRFRNAITGQLAETNLFIEAGDREDVNVHNLVGPGVFGTVTVVHNGVPGTLRGVVSQYRIVGVFPLDFEPVLQQPLLTTAGTP